MSPMVPCSTSQKYKNIGYAEAGRQFLFPPNLSKFVSYYNMKTKLWSR